MTVLNIVQEKVNKMWEGVILVVVIMGLLYLLVGMSITNYVKCDQQQIMVVLIT